MKAKLSILTTLLLSVFFFAAQAAPPIHATTADCYTAASGGFPHLGSITFDFTCSQPQTVYFGVCDSGNVPYDDLFDVRIDGLLVSRNYYNNITDEYTVMSRYEATAGTTTATVRSLSNSNYPPATYSYVASSDPNDIEPYLRAYCGVDWKGIASPSGATCSTTVHIFTQDTAPSDGTLEVHVLLGNEGSFADEQVWATIDISDGEQLNNMPVPNMPSPRYVRVWWQPDGSTDWSLLTTQYWQGGGSLADEYGVSCQGVAGGQPSYHTAFANTIPEADVCFDLINGCP